jgi:UDP-glucose 4-epimerase
MSKILVTGGCGYIGSHTIVDLVENGFSVISIDDNSRSTSYAITGIEKITGKKVKNYKVDLKNFDETLAVFQENPDIRRCDTFCRIQSRRRISKEPLLYYENNIFGLVNLMKCVQEFARSHFVFSSSCTVYGNPDSMPVTEASPTKKAESPYGATKQMGEEILQNFSRANPATSIVLRYFNPVGAHPSAVIGELPCWPAAEPGAGHHTNSYWQTSKDDGVWQ